MWDLIVLIPDNCPSIYFVVLVSGFIYEKKNIRIRLY